MLRKILLFLLLITGILAAVGYVAGSVFGALSAATLVMTLTMTIFEDWDIEFTFTAGISAFFFIFAVVVMFDIAGPILMWSAIVVMGKRLMEEEE